MCLGCYLAIPQPQYPCYCVTVFAIATATATAFLHYGSTGNQILSTEDGKIIDDFPSINEGKVIEEILSKEGIGEKIGVKRTRIGYWDKVCFF